ncbi:MAG: threonine/serine exporter ThrE family protein [Lachnospiraceae bacterium]
MSEISKIQQILDFSVHIGREMLESGANLERVSISIRRISKCYKLQEVSLVVVNNVMILSATDVNRTRYIRQEGISVCGINLKRLKKLNALVHIVMDEKPDPGKLEDMLFETLIHSPTYPDTVMIGGYVIAMLCLCRIFGGSWQDMVVVALNTVVLFFITKIFSREKLNRIISNVVSMFFCGCTAILFTKIGFSKQISPIIITNAFYLIPGIQMVNAFRNIICGNEMNGIIEMVKVVLEVITIVAGLYIACLAFGSLSTAFI